MREILAAGAAALIIGLGVGVGAATADSHRGDGRMQHGAGMHGHDGVRGDRYGHGDGYGFERMFERLDADGDGRITRAEAFDGPADRFRAADGDGDYRLTPEEFTAMMQAEAARRAAEMFPRLDRNGDGAIDPWEAPRRHAGMMERIFDRADADGDGVVTREEAEAMAAERREMRRRHHMDEDDRPRRGDGPRND